MPVRLAACPNASPLAVDAGRVTLVPHVAAPNARGVVIADVGRRR